MKLAARSFSLNGFLLLVALMTSCAQQTIIVHNLEERYANEILTYLNDHEIPATKVQAVSAGGGGRGEVLWDIQVGAERANEAMALLNAAGLPRRSGQNLLGIFGPSGLVPSEMQEQIKYQAGLAEQLSNVIRKFEGVIDSDVQLSFPKEDPLNPLASKSSVMASVWVKHSGVLDDPNSHLESKIKRLVANAVPGLIYDNVTVVGERTRNDTGSEMPEGAVTPHERPMVSVWSLILAKESLTRFRVIFFSFIVAILALLAIIGWMLWKLLPVLKRHGGIGQLFSLKPVLPAEGEKAEGKLDEKKDAGKGAPTAPGKGALSAAGTKAEKAVQPPNEAEEMEEEESEEEQS